MQLIMLDDSLVGIKQLLVHCVLSDAYRPLATGCPVPN